MYCCAGLHTIQEGEIAGLECGLGLHTVPQGLSSTPPVIMAGDDMVVPYVATTPDQSPDQGQSPGRDQGDWEHTTTGVYAHVHVHVPALENT